MAKSSTTPSRRDALIRECARHSSFSKKSLKKAVEEATIRLMAEQIAQEHLQTLWKEMGVASEGKLKNPVPKSR